MSVLRDWNFSSVEFGPRACGHVSQIRFLPGIVRMHSEKRLGVKRLAARMSHAGNQAKLLRHCRIAGLALHGAAGIIWSPGPNFDPARRNIHVAAKRALVRLLFFLE